MIVPHHLCCMSSTLRPPSKNSGWDIDPMTRKAQGPQAWWLCCIRVSMSRPKTPGVVSIVVWKYLLPLSHKKFSLEVQATGRLPPQSIWHGMAVLSSGRPALLTNLTMVFWVSCPMAEKPSKFKYPPTSILNLEAFWANKENIEYWNQLHRSFLQMTTSMALL